MFLCYYTMTGVQSILKSYDLEDLQNIAENGCASGCAHNHIYYSETTKFYDEHEYEINAYAEDCFGDEFLSIFAKDTITKLKNNLVWFFVEAVANDYAYRQEVA